MSRWRVRLALILALIGLSLALAPSASADVRTEARRAFRRGMQLIGEGHVDQGIASLEEAYDILPHPNVLYNIGRAYADAGRYEEALEYYEEYLASDPPDRDEVQGYLLALRDRLSATQAEAAAAAIEPEPEQVIEVASEPIAPTASEEEIDALEEAADQIAALAAATQSDALRERADRLRLVAQSLRDDARRASELASGQGVASAAGDASGGGADPGTTGAAAGAGTGTGTGELGEGGAPADGIDLGEERGDDLYAEQVVSSSRFAQSPLDAPNSTHNITAQDIRLTGHFSLPEMMRRVAGVEVMTTTGSATDINIRGLNQRLAPRAIVLVDGRYASLDTLGNVFWPILTFNPEDIERIEVVRGPASALYGANAFSGIINIITKEPGPARTDIGVGVGSGGQLHGHVATSGRAGRLAYRLAAGYNGADRFTREASDARVGPEGDLETTSVYTDAAREGYHVYGRLRYRLSSDVMLNAQAGVNDNTQNFQSTGPLRDWGAYGPTVFGMGSVDTSWGSIRAFWNNIIATTGPPAVPRGSDPLISNFISNTVDVEATFARQFELLVEHNLTFGLGYRYKQIAWDFLSGEQTENHYATFVQDTIGISDQLILVGSLRVDFHPLLEEPMIAPRGAIIFKPTQRQSIRAAIGQAFRTQTFLESYLQLSFPTPVAGVGAAGLGAEVGGQNLQPERILSAELGYRWAESDYFDFELAAYYNLINGLVFLHKPEYYTLGDFADQRVGYDSTTSRFPVAQIEFGNDPTEFRQIGAELGFRVFPATGLDIYANYSIHDTSPIESEQGGAAVSLAGDQRTSRHKINAGVQYRSSFGLDLALDFHFASSQVWSEQAFDLVDGVKFVNIDLPAYYLVNARVGYRLFDDRLELGVVGFNLTDHRHRQHPFGQVLGMRVMGTLAYHF